MEPGRAAGNEWNLCQTEHVFNPMEISSTIREFFGKWKRPFCHFEMSPFIEV